MFWFFGNLFGVRWLDVYFVVLVIFFGFVICLWYLCVFDVFVFGLNLVVLFGIFVFWI